MIGKTTRIVVDDEDNKKKNGGSTTHVSASEREHGGSSGSFGGESGAALTGQSGVYEGEVRGKSAAAGDFEKAPGAAKKTPADGAEGSGGAFYDGGAQDAAVFPADDGAWREAWGEGERIATAPAGPRNDEGTGEELSFAYTSETPRFNAPAADAELEAQYRGAMQALEEMKHSAPRYGSEYDEQIRALYEQIVTRGPFRYDASTDPLYRQYAEAYTAQGERAMRDTMGRAAALTGGYGSSYAQSVGQQEYDEYLRRLAEVLPQTYAAAREDYEAEGEALQEKLAAARELEGRDYERYLDRLGQYNRELDAARSEADTAYARMTQEDERAYSRAQDAYARETAAEKEAYERAQDDYARRAAADETRARRESEDYSRALEENKLAYERAQAEGKLRRSEREAYYQRLLGLIEAGYEPTAEDLAMAGLSAAQARALVEKARA